jgi:maltose O-acetyltransferase
MLNYLKEIIFFPIFNLQLRVPFYDEIRFIFLKLSGANLQGRSVFYGNMTFRPYGGLSKLTIGEKCFLNEKIRVSCSKSKVSIGKYCLIGPNVSFECASHGIEYIEGKGRGLLSKDIFVRDRVWIGAGTIILGGVEIGDDVVVGANSLVNKDLEPGWIYYGIPAKKIKKILKGVKK